MIFVCLSFGITFSVSNRESHLLCVRAGVCVCVCGPRCECMDVFGAMKPTEKIPLNIIRVDKRHESVRERDGKRHHGGQLALAGLIGGHVQDVGQRGPMADGQLQQIADGAGQLVRNRARLQLGDAAERGDVGVGVRALDGNVEHFAGQHVRGAVEAACNILGSRLKYMGEMP